MRTIRSDIDGHFRVEDDLTMYGVFSCPVYVARGGHLVLHGTCADGLLVGAGGHAEIFGTIRGDLVSYGRVTLAGTVTGKVADQGQMTVEPGASMLGDQSKSLVGSIDRAAADSLAPKTGRRPRLSSWSGQRQPAVAAPPAEESAEAPGVTEPEGPPGDGPAPQCDPPEGS